MTEQVSTYKTCPACKRRFSADTQQCPTDGMLLLGPDPRIGTLIDGKFRIIDVLGEGASGIVYKAQQIGFEREVAVKLLKLLSANDISAVKRFRREAQAMSQLRHQNIASVYAFGITAEGSAYLVFELVDGERLSDYLARRAQRDISLAIEICRQLCAALSCLHRADLIHRDIKPGNLMVVWQANGAPLLKVLDFGSVKFTAATPGAEQRLTQAGEVLGTASYCSPEQAAGVDVDARSDIYSAGRVLFELTNQEGMVPAYLAPIVARAMEHSPGSRYQSADEMSAALAKVAAEAARESAPDVDVAVGTARNEERRRRLLRLAAAAACAFFVSGIAAFALSDSASCAVLKSLNTVSPDCVSYVYEHMQNLLAQRPLTRRYLCQQAFERAQSRDPSRTSKEFNDAASAYVMSECAAGNRFVANAKLAEFAGHDRQFDLARKYYHKALECAARESKLDPVEFSENFTRMMKQAGQQV